MNQPQLQATQQLQQSQLTAYMPQYDMSSSSISNQSTVNAPQQQFRIGNAGPPSSLTAAPPGSQAPSYYTTPNQPPTAASQLGFFAQLSAAGTSALQPAAASPFGVGLVPTPQGTAMAGLVIGQQAMGQQAIGQQATGWGQPGAGQMKGFNKATGAVSAGNNLQSQLAGITGGQMPPQPFPIQAAQNTFAMGQNSNISEFNMATGQLQQAGQVSSTMKWSPNMIAQSEKNSQNGQNAIVSSLPSVQAKVYIRITHLSQPQPTLHIDLEIKFSVNAPNWYSGV